MRMVPDSVSIELPVVMPSAMPTQEQKVTAAFPSYDYQSQEWREWSDHGHMLGDGVVWCGADLRTCQG